MKKRENIYITRIIQAFKANVEALAEETHPLSYDFRTAYLDKEKKEPAALAGFLHYGKLVLEFVYLTKTDQNGPKSVLECRVWLSESRLPLYYSLYDLMDMIDPGCFTCCMYPYIENAQRMNTCFSALAAGLKRFLPRLMQIAADPDLCAQAQLKLLEDIKNCWDPGLFDVDKKIEEERRKTIIENRMEMYRDWERKRFCDEGYRAFLSGDYEKAQRYYAKQKKRLSYENRLLSFLRDNASKQPDQAIKQGADSLADASSMSKGRAGILPLIVSSVVLSVLFYAVYTGAYYASLRLINLGALYVTGMEWSHTAPLILPALLTGVALTFCFRRRLYRLVLRKRAEHLIEYDAILNTGMAFRMMGALTIVAVAVSLLFTLMSANNNVAFYEDTVTNRSARGALSGESFSYGEIKEVLVLRGHRPDGSVFTKFALMTRNNGGLELSDYMSEQEFETKLLPLLQDKGISVTRIDKNSADWGNTAAA